MHLWIITYYVKKEDSSFPFRIGITSMKKEKKNGICEENKTQSVMKNYVLLSFIYVHQE